MTGTGATLFAVLALVAAAMYSREGRSFTWSEIKKRLRGLGYLGSESAAEEQGSWSRRDPKDVVHLIPLMHEGIGLCARDHWDEGIPILMRVLEEDPVNAKALFWVA